MIFLKKKPTSKTQLAELIKELVKEKLFTEVWKVDKITQGFIEKTKATKYLLPNFDGVKKKK